MPTTLQNLRKRRDDIAAELAALTESGAGGLPNVSGGGATTDHVGYKDGLYRELDRLDELIDAERIREEGAVIIDTHGIV